MLVDTTAFLPPLDPAPDLEDAIGWARVPDDDLTAISRTDLAAPVREQALAEMERREQGGWATSQLGMPPIRHS